MPRRDTKPLAKALLARFGTFAEVLNAPDDFLCEVQGIGEAPITELRLVRTAALRLIRGEVIERPVLASWTQVLDYCSASMQFRILFLVSVTRSLPTRRSRTARLTIRPSMCGRW